MWCSRTCFLSTRPRPIGSLHPARRQKLGVWARSHKDSSGPNSRNTGHVRRRLQLLATSTMSEITVTAAEDEYVTLDRTMGSMDLSPTSSLDETAVSYPNTVPVQFVVPEYVTEWGQKLKVVGSAQELGNWVPDQAPAMHWHDGHFWTLDVELPVGTVNFKVVMAQENGYVRWEDGDNRSVEVPGCLPDNETPVGHVDITCNWNDVQNSQSVLRPDRQYLRDKLRLVEAKVVAIQERKKRLDTKMLQLNSNLQEFDRVVMALEEDVNEAMQDNQREALQRAAAEAAAYGTSAMVASQPPAVGPAELHPVSASNGNGNGANSRPAFMDLPPPVMVPILDPQDLEPIDVAAAHKHLAEWDSQHLNEPEAAASTEMDQQLEELLGAHADQAAAADADAEQQQVTAVVPREAAVLLQQQQQEDPLVQRLSESVLAVTVQRLIAAAEDALDQEPPDTPGEAAVDTTQLAVDYLTELEAAAAALEKETDNRLAQLLAAALRSNGGVPDDLESLVAPAAPSRPGSRSSSLPASLISSWSSPVASYASYASTASSSYASDGEEEPAVLAHSSMDADDAWPAADTSAPDSPASAPLSPFSPAPVAVPTRSADAAVSDEQPPSPRFTVVASFSLNPQYSPGPKEEAVTFSAADLQVQVDPAELLARVLQRTLSNHFQEVVVDDVVAAVDAAAVGGGSRVAAPQQPQLQQHHAAPVWAEKVQVAAAAREAATARVAAAQREAEALREAALASLEGMRGSMGQHN